jgi:hypothetical protein
MKPAKLVTATLVAGLLAAPLLEGADEPHTHAERDLQLLDAYSINCLSPSITGQEFDRSEEQILLIAHANAALARWWTGVLEGVNNNDQRYNWLGSAIYGFPRTSRASPGLLCGTRFNLRQQSRGPLRQYTRTRRST